VTYRTVLGTIVDILQSLVKGDESDQGEDERDDGEEGRQELQGRPQQVVIAISACIRSRTAKETVPTTETRLRKLTVKMNPGKPPLCLKMANNSPKKAKLANPAEMAVMIKDPVRPLGLPGMRG
jgi:hypothetical protein